MNALAVDYERKFETLSPVFKLTTFYTKLGVWDVRWLQCRMLDKHFDCVSGLYLTTCLSSRNRTNQTKR
jgi:hypothetical protein